MKINLLSRFILPMFIIAMFSFYIPLEKTPVSGTWQCKKGTDTWILMAVDNYCMVTHFDSTHKKFYNSFGGFQFVNDNQLSIDIRFDAANKMKNGLTQKFTWQMKGTTVQSNISGEVEVWEKTGDAKKEMAGVYRITKRKVNDDLKDIPLANRRTLKLLTDDYFQWAAIDISTGGFFGTGGGKYQYKNGTYTENIEFFSKDSSRVGLSLQFKGQFDGKNWLHIGASSKGDPVHEVWSKALHEEM